MVSEVLIRFLPFSERIGVYTYVLRRVLLITLFNPSQDRINTNSEFVRASRATVCRFYLCGSPVSVSVFAVVVATPAVLEAAPLPVVGSDG